MEGSEAQRSTSILLGMLADPDSNEAFRRFTGKYLPRMKVCCRGLGMQDADADDICASVLLRFLERGEFRKFVFDSKEKFNHWLNTVVRHAVFTFVRDRGRQPDAWSVGNSGVQRSLDSVAAQVADELAECCRDDLARGERARTIVRERVDAKTMRAFELMFYDERKGADVAAELGMSLTAVWKARSRVAKMLQEEFRKLEDLDIEDGHRAL
ncbi:MAG TPA: sigma-70 family RNA polymerase sigma factor [Pirellulales bacterium]|nr:sigma-70 family RNA polymerase sigma factor [Pirellulales bacterium]